VKLHVSCRLNYTLDKPVDFIFQVHAAKSSTQAVGAERFSISSNPPISTFEAMGSLNRLVRTKIGPGQATVDYEAEVDVALRRYDPASVNEYDYAMLPPETLVYLLPSRFCPSDLFNELAEQRFGNAPRGYARALAIADWVHAELAYVAGSTGPHSTSADAFQQKQGVCRDFAHLAISVCRAAGIPARYISVYADAMSPPDFHAVVEVYLHSPDGGAWFTLDPTHMASVDAVARIAAGRDAADVAFAWTQGDCDSTAPQVKVTAPARSDTARTAEAVVGV
jgi:transglutaminase-like putative cysteine protease